jgi:Transglutaminase-like superfamily/Coenzyme PQQ synthesis protein D (PqqD)
VPTAPHIPHHVHAAACARGGGVLLDTRSGQWYAMNPTAHLLWREWHRTGDFDAAVRAVAVRHPGVRGERIRADAERLAADLTARGLMAPDGPAPRTPAAPGDAAARPGPSRGGSVTAALGFVTALCLLRLPFGAAVRFLRAGRRRWCRGAATPEQTRAVLAAVRRVAGRYPGRAACLELSLAAVVTLALTRRAADWCLGSADDPFRFHAWVEVAGCPVVEPGDTETAAFRRVFAV